MITEEVAMITEEAFMDIVALHRQGHSMRFIAKRLELHRNTVKKYILCKRFPEYRRSERRIPIPGPLVRSTHEMPLITPRDVAVDDLGAHIWVMN
jgi:hypothetical protein